MMRPRLEGSRREKEVSFCLFSFVPVCFNSHECDFDNGEAELGLSEPTDSEEVD